MRSIIDQNSTLLSTRAAILGCDRDRRFPSTMLEAYRTSPDSSLWRRGQTDRDSSGGHAVVFKPVDAEKQRSEAQL